MVLQFLGGLCPSVEQAALVKAKVWSEPWRLWSCAWLHGHVFHLLCNVTALLWLGRLVEALGHRSLLATVLFLSILSGSAFSCLLYPSTPSVGISGGLMGLIGFLIILGLRRRGSLPRDFVRSLLRSTLLVALFGLIASDMIDNGAHLGGLLAGLLLGHVLLRQDDLAIPVRTGFRMKLVGLLCAGMLALSAVHAAGVLIRGLVAAG
jgi:membrane associated rhomboid family serine protease